MRIYSLCPQFQLKFVFSKKATKIDEIFTVDLTLTIDGEDSSIFVAFLENMNFNDPFGSFMHGFLELYALPCRRFHGSPLPPGYLKTYFSVTLLITLFKLDQIM